jgi:hypothetical protein
MATFESMCTAHEYRMEHNVVRWFHAMLKNQQMVMAQMGCMMRVSTGGSPVPLPRSFVDDGLLL